MTTLDQLENGETGIINQINGDHGFTKRLESLNLRKGKSIRKISAAPFQGPVVLEVDGCQIALGRGLASRVVVDTS